MLHYSKNLCPHCGPIQTSHYQQWIADLFYLLTPFRFFGISPGAKYFLSTQIDRFFMRVGAVKTTNDMDHPGFPLRSKVFLREVQALGMNFGAVLTAYGLNNQFILLKDGKRFHFEGLPRAEFKQSRLADKIDDKVFVKKILGKNGLPNAQGRAFTVLSAKEARKYAKTIGFPVIVKPVTGSMSQHITLNIKTKEELRSAIQKVLQYTPYFMVERYIRSPFVFRATVIDQDFVAVVKRIPAHVIGDGSSSVQQLVDMKNADPRRGPAGDQSFVLYHIKVDDTSHRLLAERGYSLDSTPEAGEVVYLQEKVILDLGADIEEVTGTVHPDNIEMFQRVSKVFGIYLVGVDFLASDISISWKDQECALLELNSLPYIDMHHYPSIGHPVNIGREVAKMVERHYG